jgi:hypothetical protein
VVDDDQVYLVPAGCAPTRWSSPRSTGPTWKEDPGPGPAAALLPGQHDLPEIAVGHPVHQPYDSFAASFEAFVRTAASDPT